MLELLTGSGMAMAAGLNAYIPLLALGLMSRLTDLVGLPAGWQWLESTPALVILAVLLVVEVVADKIPVVDSVNDAVQTLVRPTAGGIVFAAGAGSQTGAITDPATLAEEWRWVPVVLGVVLALATHLTKSAARPVANAGTGGLAAPMVSTAEDASAVVLVAVSVLLPVLVAALVAALAVLVVLALRRRLRRRRAHPA